MSHWSISPFLPERSAGESTIRKKTPKAASQTVLQKSLLLLLLLPLFWRFILRVKISPTVFSSYILLVAIIRLLMALIALIGMMNV
jgi:uncharacterized membrane protein